MFLCLWKSVVFASFPMLPPPRPLLGVEGRVGRPATCFYNPESFVCVELSPVFFINVEFKVSFVLLLQRIMNVV